MILMFHAALVLIIACLCNSEHLIEKPKAWCFESKRESPYQTFKGFKQKGLLSGEDSGNVEILASIICDTLTSDASFFSTAVCVLRCICHNNINVTRLL